MFRGPLSALVNAGRAQQSRISIRTKTVISIGVRYLATTAILPCPRSFDLQTKNMPLMLTRALTNCYILFNINTALPEFRGQVLIVFN